MNNELKRCVLKTATRRHSPAVSPSDIISAKTLAPNERLSVLSHNSGINHEDSSEPLPQFSRDVNFGYQRFEAAKREATEKGKEKEESSE